MFIIQFLMELMGVGEFLPSNLLMDCLASLFCHETEITQGLCTNILFVLCGFDEAQVGSQAMGWLTLALPVIKLLSCCYKTSVM